MKADFKVWQEYPTQTESYSANIEKTIFDGFTEEELDVIHKAAEILKRFSILQSPANIHLSGNIFVKAGLISWQRLGPHLP